MIRPSGALAAGLVLLAAGCGDGLYPVSGTVQWKGADLAQGNIIFRDPEGKLAPGAAKIINGRFEVRLTPGPKRVEIYAERQTRFNKEMNQYEREQYIPQRYNGDDSVLRADVGPGKENQLRFDLTDKP
jgi:hypothetical protein